MSPPPCNGTTFFRRCLLGWFLSMFLTNIKILDGTLRYCVARSQRPTMTTSIIRPNRSQFYVQFDLNYTSNSISIIRPIRPQFYVQFDLNYTSNSTSILRPIRPQFYVHIETNGTNFFLPTVRSWGDMKTPTPDNSFRSGPNVRRRSVGRPSDRRPSDFRRTSVS